MRQLLYTFTILTLLIAACNAAPTPPPPISAAATAVVAVAPTTPSVAAISHIKGDADQRLDETSVWNVASIGQSLASGNQVRTGVESLATVQFAQGAITRLGPETAFTVIELSGDAQNPLIKLHLSLGQLFVIIKDSLGSGAVEIETPVGSAAVRGSLMSVKVTEQGRVEIACLETSGKCVVENDHGAVELESGQQTEIDAADEPPAPVEQIEEDVLAEWFETNPETQTIVEADADGDGFTLLDGDCNDGDAAIQPNADDPAGDGIDGNCDAADGAQPDNDGDGDDADSAINPNADDSTQDGIDQNCDGVDGPIDGEPETATTAEPETPEPESTEALATDGPAADDPAPEATESPAEDPTPEESDEPPPTPEN